MVHICHLISIVLYYQYSPLPRSTILTLQGSGNRRLTKFISTNKKKGHSQIYFSQTSNWTKQGSTMLQSMIPHEKDQQDISHKWGRPYSSKTRVRYKTNVAQTTKQSGICIKFLFFLHDKFFFYLSRSRQTNWYLPSEMVEFDPWNQRSVTSRIKTKYKEQKSIWFKR